MPSWLPGLLRLSDFGGDWSRYQEALYAEFCRDFLGSSLWFGPQSVRLKRLPILDGKEATFWHFISEGKVEHERLPDLRRCERIRWPRAIIERPDDPALKVWRNERHGDRRVCLWLEAEDYLVVLADRGSFVLPWTAYMVEESHRKRKLQKEFEEYLRRQSAP